ncbi:MAG TPA: hypothetical protein VMW24_15900 [Sedimentisphaerales bacterium]|nr:hypothetical protein [Sedimentisphaerales bacterium]
MKTQEKWSIVAASRRISEVVEVMSTKMENISATKRLAKNLNGMAKDLMDEAVVKLEVAIQDLESVKTQLDLMADLDENQMD